MTQIEVSKGEAPRGDSNTERPKEVVHDESPALITGHKYAPRAEWWTLCKYCGLGEAAHAETELAYYGDDDPEL